MRRAAPPSPAGDLPLGQRAGVWIRIGHRPLREDRDRHLPFTPRLPVGERISGELLFPLQDGARGSVPLPLPRGTRGGGPPGDLRVQHVPHPLCAPDAATSVRTAMDPPIGRCQIRRKSVLILGVLTPAGAHPEVDLRTYAKYILKEGTNEEKRELIGCFKSKIKVTKKVVTIE